MGYATSQTGRNSFPSRLEVAARTCPAAPQAGCRERLYGRWRSAEGSQTATGLCRGGDSRYRISFTSVGNPRMVEIHATP
jgi:hypothetical protein